MTRQQRRHLDRELMKCAQRNSSNNNEEERYRILVDHNHKEFLSKKAARLRR